MSLVDAILEVDLPVLIVLVILWIVNYLKTREIAEKLDDLQKRAR